MQFCYGDKNHVRILEEAEFWKRQESEHTVVIREIVRNLEKEFVEKLKEFQEIFSSTEAIVVQYTVLRESSAVKNNLAAIVVINHIIRESEYHIGIAKAYLNHMAYC